MSDTLTAEDIIAARDSLPKSRTTPLIRYMHPYNRHHVTIVHIQPRLDCAVCWNAWGEAVGYESLEALRHD